MDVKLDREIAGLLLSWYEKNKLRMNHIFTVGNLVYLSKEAKGAAEPDINAVVAAAHDELDR